MGRQWELQLLLPFSFYIDAKVLLFFELAKFNFECEPHGQKCGTSGSASRTGKYVRRVRQVGRVGKLGGLRGLGRLRRLGRLRGLGGLRRLGGLGRLGGLETNVVFVS